MIGMNILIAVSKFSSRTLIPEHFDIMKTAAAMRSLLLAAYHNYGQLLENVGPERFDDAIAMNKKVVLSHTPYTHIFIALTTPNLLFIICLRRRLQLALGQRIPRSPTRWLRLAMSISKRPTLAKQFGGIHALSRLFRATVRTSTSGLCWRKWEGLWQL